MHKLRFLSVLFFCFLASFTQAQDFKIENAKGFISPVIEVKGKGFAVVYDLDGKSKKNSVIDFYDYDYNKISSTNLAMEGLEEVNSIIANDNHVAVLISRSTTLRMVSFEFASGQQIGSYVFTDISVSETSPLIQISEGDEDEFFVATFNASKTNTSFKCFDSNLKLKWEYNSEGVKEKKTIQFSKILVLYNQIIAIQKVYASNTSQQQLISFSRSTGQVKNTIAVTEHHFQYLLLADTIDNKVYTVVSKFPDFSKIGKNEERKQFITEQKESKTALLNYTISIYDKDLDIENTTTIDFNNLINGKIKRPEKLSEEMMYTFPLQLLKTKEGYTLINQIIFWKTTVETKGYVGANGTYVGAKSSSKSALTYDFLMINFDNTLDFIDFYLINRERSICRYSMLGLQLATNPSGVYDLFARSNTSAKVFLFSGATLSKDGKIQLVYFDRNKDGMYNVKVGDNKKRSQELTQYGDEDAKSIDETTVAFYPTLLEHNSKKYILVTKTVNKSCEFFDYPRL